jgi:hypothetical protein
MTDTAPARSITKSVTIDRPAPDVHPYLADARNFDRQAALVDTELAKLKDILESQPPTPA